MRVAELIEVLQKLDPNAKVVLSSFEKVHMYTPLDYVEDGFVYVPWSTYLGNLYLADLTADDELYGYTESDVYRGDDGEPAVLLVPTD